ncbi:ATP-grasp domain-containing protein [Desulfovibrio sp. JC010]|uniref:ATP-grasp domain-containing protein n=1 Tax=Desulfovibrio sp. JC010 TaxID=2593641 RepID=UPI0013D21A0F|nr:ATP-grasp domain-containing protein [Desulfovibrio sp. JC010]NDV25926.1 ATP-grasp domain-containing protein [Desulfovibrio sp. JC010]
MFIVEKPYVSELLKKTLAKLGKPVLENEVASEALQNTDVSLSPENDFVTEYNRDRNQPVYSNSENAIDWIDSNLKSGDLPRTIRLFKDKGAFRDLVRDMYPDFFYRTLKFEELDSVNAEELPIPCVVKPCVGFFSLGVHMVESVAGWTQAVERIKTEVEEIKTMYPAKVLELDNFIIEECIEGEEFAVDAYYDAEGNPVIINILGHLFASSDDVSDRCYITSTEIINQHHDEFLNLLQEIGSRAELKNFPIHIEVRTDGRGNLGVIEVNPMRFAGWCVTDLAHYAYSINPYKYFMEGLKPDWAEISRCCEGKVYGMVIGEIDSSVDRSQIKSVYYDGFKANFSKVLELREIDYTKHPVFAFIFAEVGADNMDELKKMLHADFTEYLKF